MNKDCGHRRIYSPTQGANGVPFTDLLADRFHSLSDKSCAAPKGPRVADVEHKIAKDFRAAVGMPDLRVELNGVELTRRVFSGGDRVAGLASHVEAGGQGAHVIPVAVPDAEFLRNAREEGRAVPHAQAR